MLLLPASVCLVMAWSVASFSDGNPLSAPGAAAVGQQGQSPVTAGQSAPESENQAPAKDRHKGRAKRSSRTSSRRQSVPIDRLDDARPSREAGPTRREMTVTANVLGGYDGASIGSQSGSAVVPGMMARGSNGNMDAMLGYFRGNALRSIKVETTGNLIAYPGYGIGPAAGGSATIESRATAGRNTTFRAAQRFGSQPLFSLYSPGLSSAPLPPGTEQAVSVTGLYLRRSMNSSTAVSIDRAWSGRDSTSFSYSYATQRFSDSERGNNATGAAAAQYRRRLARSVTGRVAYSYSSGEYTDYEAVARSMREHKIEGGPEIRTALSRRRSLTLTLGGGASYLESPGMVETVSRWVPTGSASAALDLTAAWALDGGYRRGFSPLQGLTDDVYTTDTMFVGARGNLTGRTNLRFGLTSSNWKTTQAPGVSDTMRIYGASLQLGVTLTPTVALTAVYSYYHHRYSNPESLAAGFPAQYHLNSIRLGLTLRVPLVTTLLPR